MVTAAPTMLAQQRCTTLQPTAAKLQGQDPVQPPTPPPAPSPAPAALTCALYNIRPGVCQICTWRLTLPHAV